MKKEEKKAEIELKLLLADDLLKMLKFVQKQEFSDPSIYYKQSQILSAFTLYKKVNVYDEESRIYSLFKSEILQKILKCSMSFRQDEIWTKLLKSKCTMVIDQNNFNFF